MATTIAEITAMKVLCIAHKLRVRRIVSAAQAIVVSLRRGKSSSTRVCMSKLRLLADRAQIFCYFSGTATAIVIVPTARTNQLAFVTRQNELALVVCLRAITEIVCLLFLFATATMTAAIRVTKMPDTIALTTRVDRKNLNANQIEQPEKLRVFSITGCAMGTQIVSVEKMNISRSVRTEMPQE